MNYRLIRSVQLVMALGFLFSCRGEISKKPPVHLNLNMDFQPKKKSQSLSRKFPEGVVGFGYNEDPLDAQRRNFLKADRAYFEGKNNGFYVDRIPLEVDQKLLKLGQKNFNIYCSVCHDRVGTSRGMVIQRGAGMPPPPELASKNLIDMPDGEIFEVISVGRRNMPGYATQMDSLDRWGVVAYVRALQTARTAGVDDVPVKKRLELNRTNQ